MKIERIVLPSVQATNGLSYHCWLHCPDKKILVHFDGIRGGDYNIETVIGHAITSGDDGYFKMTDGFDSSSDVRIKSSEIRRLGREIISAIPGNIGRLILSIGFEPCDPSIPF